MDTTEIEGAGWIGLSESERSTIRELSRNHDIKFVIEGPTQESVEARGREFIEQSGYGYGPHTSLAIEDDGRWYMYASRYASCE